MKKPDPALNTAALHMRLPAGLLTQAHELAARRGLSVASLFRMLLLRELAAAPMGLAPAPTA